MKAYGIAAILLIVVGVLVLVYGRITYTKDAESAQLGPIELTVTEKETVNIPDWVGIGCLASGAVMLAFPLLKN
jgi:hypothetical protein